MDTGLMQPQPNKTATTSSPLLEQFRAILSPTGGSPRTLEEKLAALSEAELQSIKQTAIDCKELLVERQRLEQMMRDLTLGDGVSPDKDYTGGFAEKYSK